MESSFFTKAKASFSQVNHWFHGTPDRSLEQAYKAALMIRAIEDEHFEGKKVCTQSKAYGDNVNSYFQSDLNKYLRLAKVRLAEFKISRSFMDIYEQNPIFKANNSKENINQWYSVQNREEPAIFIEKLKFIDEVLTRYTPEKDKKSSYSLVPISNSNIVPVDEETLEKTRTTYQPISSSQSTVVDVETASDKTGLLPRSLMRTFKRIQQELDPKAEDEVVKNFRTSKIKTAISIRFLLLLILVPLLTQQVAKNFLVGPIVERVTHGNSSAIFLNVNLEEEAFTDLERFEKQLKFKTLIGIPSKTTKGIEEQLKDKAFEIKEEYLNRSINAIKNVFADLLSLIAFGWVIFISKKAIAVLKSFIDEIVYGLSDSAKAFVIILFTDIFVGYHSPHGWEIILESMARHLGLPENRDFNFLFIATFPVILDTVFKYWIFRYLNRISPSSVATYKNMNE